MVAAQDKPKAKKKLQTATLVHEGVKYPMFREPKSGAWRVRKRTKFVRVDFSTGNTNLAHAKDAAADILARNQQEVKRRSGGASTLQELCDIYKRMPKRVSEDVAADNINRLAKVVRVAWGKNLDDVRLSDLTSQLWEDYAAMRQGGKLDLATRTEGNRGINAAMRMASSIFSAGLARAYEKEGVRLDLHAVTRIQWLPEIQVKILPLSTDSLDAFHAALPALRADDYPMWRAVMIARYSGLRSGEISAARKNWLERRKSGVLGFAVHDRPDQGYLHKTGEDYFAPITSRELEEDLLAGPDGELVNLDLSPVRVSATGRPVPRTSRDKFFRNHCNNWLRNFFQKPHKGMHRLRALYLEEIRDTRVAEVLAEAEREGNEAAKSAAGHTSINTTKTHYLPAL